MTPQTNAMKDSLLINNIQHLVNKLAKSKQELPQVVSEKGKALAEIDDHVAVERNHQAMNEMRGWNSRLSRTRLRRRQRANDQAVREVRVELAGIQIPGCCQFWGRGSGRY